MTVFFMDEKKITKLAVQKNNRQRINVFLDDEFAFGISRAAGAWLQIGQALSQFQIDELLSKDLDETIHGKSLEYLNIRARSEEEMRKKLQDRGFEEDRINSEIVHLKNSHLLDDKEFSALWVENRNSLHPRSQRLIAYELRRKGITEEIIHDSLQDVDDDQTAFDLAFRYSKRLSNLDWQSFRKRIGGYLARKGFGYETINQVTRRIWSEKEESDEDR